MAAAASRGESRRLLATDVADSEDSDAAEAYVSSQPRSRLPERAALLAAVVGVAAVVAIASADQGSLAVGGGPEILGLAASLPAKPLPFIATQACYGFTGGTCNVRGCEVGNGAVCLDNKCVCSASCVGADGVCYTGEPNTLIKSSFSLTNAKWPSYSMYVQQTSRFGQLKATNSYSWLNQETDKFLLYKMPGNPSSSSQERFFLGSTAYPQFVARVAPTKSSSFSSQGLFAADLTSAYNPSALALVACYNASAQALMFGNDAESSWVYLTQGSWLIYGYNGEKEDVGQGGLWRPYPPFTDLEASFLPAC